jgi:arsenate reductase
LLNDEGIEFTYREYTQDPLSESEIRDVLGKLGMGPRDVLRSRDANKAGLSGAESDDRLIELMANNPRLLQRPIGVVGSKAAVGRPAEQLLTIL